MPQIKTLSIIFVLILSLHTLSYAEELSLHTFHGKLSGTLEIPAGTAKPPVVLIIAGSGPTDRDGNNNIGMRTDCLKMYAEQLAASGTASLRYDKRGIAGSAGSASMPEEQFSFETYINDAVSWAEMLEGSGRFSKVYIAGHSEGALIGAAAAKIYKPAGLISIAGIGSPPYDVLEEQFRSRMPYFLDEVKRINNLLKNGEFADDIPSELIPVFRKSIQPYIISWYRYNPAKVYSELDIPVLIIHGTTDIQVNESEADILAAAVKNGRLVKVEGMNHIFKKIPADIHAQYASYNSPGVPIMQEPAEESVKFIKAQSVSDPAD